MTNILFVNHRQKQCGVQAMGSRYYANLAESRKFQCFYIDVDQQAEFEYWFEQIKPAAVVWNFYSHATMDWMSAALIRQKAESAKQLAIYHELPLESLGFDLILHQDPDPPENDSFPAWALPRSIPLYSGEAYRERNVPRFGSFGFGLGGKGFARLVEQVCAEYDEANIHLHIPFAHFGDADGVAARAHAADARSAVSKPGVALTIDHSFWDESVLLEWLAGNTCNCFLYDPHYGRGISGTTDYALAAKRPIAITKSWQFRHIWGVDDRFCIENNSLKAIVALGTAPTEKFRQMWSREAFVHSFEAALESVGV